MRDKAGAAAKSESIKKDKLHRQGEIMKGDKLHRQGGRKGDKAAAAAAANFRNHHPLRSKNPYSFQLSGEQS